jgi:sugar phosphate isomerase/epimerase
MRALSLHQVIAPDATPLDLVRTAAALDCPHVCLFTESAGATFPFPVVQDADVPELRRAMDELGVSALGATTFPLAAATNVTAYAAGLERAGRLGASIASVRLADPDPGRRADNFARLAELAAPHGIELSIEFTGFGARTALDEALAAVAHAGRGGVTLDPLHVVRTGASLDTLRRNRGRIAYVQFCDGPLAGAAQTYGVESGYHRLPPGEGEFPLLELLEIAPADLPISLEVPQEPARQAGVDVATRCARAVDGMRRLLAQAG